MSATFSNTLDSTPPARKAVVTGQILSGIAVLFLAFDAAMKVLAVPAALQATIQLGYPAAAIVPIGVMEIIACSST